MEFLSGKKWNSLNKDGSLLSSRINGETDEEGIANEFASYFESVYGGADSEVYSDLKKDFVSCFSRYYSDHVNDDISPYFVSWSNMLDLASKIQIGESSAGILRPEHFVYGAPELLVHFQILFNGMIQHSYVPTDFLKGTITPIVKDSQGDVSSTANYRGITLSCLPAKLFELAIQQKTHHLLQTDDLQFGFKAKTSTSHAIYTLKATVHYFNDKGSNVYVAFLDCSKAFDRISHHGLFKKLIDRKVPLCILLCLIYWYSNMTCHVKWGSAKSREFPVPLGIKQGGINSPDLFGCYADDLIQLLRKCKVGCHLYKLYLAIIMFADDICLIAPSLSALQRLIDISSSYCHKMGLDFNPKKSKTVVFSKSKMKAEDLKPITLNGATIEYVPSVKYLGVTVSNDRGFAFQAGNELRSFYRAANSILTVVQKPSEEVQLHLLYSNCVPILTYCSSIKTFSAHDMRECNTAINNCLRKIFSFHRWESIRSLRESFGKKDIYEIFALSAKKFHASLSTHSNYIIREIAKSCTTE